MAYAAVHIPEFPALALLRLRPGNSAGAVAVLQGVAPLERVVSFNRAGKAFGLEHGMSKVQAETMGPVCFHLRSLAEEQSALDLVFEAAEGFSPRVQIVASPVNGYAGSLQPAVLLLLDRQGTERLFGDGRSFATKLREALQAKQFPANVATAPNAEASLLLARSYRAITAAEANDVPSLLAPLPPSALGCEADILSTLERWGIRNLGELAALPEAALISRLGQRGKRLQRLARGTEDHLLTPENPAFLLADQLALDSPLESLESVLFVVSPMLEKLLQRALQHAYALRSVTLSLALEKGLPHELVVRPATPVQGKEMLLKLLHLKLQAEPPGAGIVGVALQAEPALPQVTQRGLFQAQFPESGKLDLLLARLKGIAGEDKVGSPALRNSHREDEFLILPFQPVQGKDDGVTELTKPTSARPALRRFRPLQVVKVILREGFPSLLFWKGVRLSLSEIAGPWQASGYWWDGRQWAANEWDAVIAQPPQVLLLRHEPETNAWYVAGQYD